jgi:hypothetical protein
MGGIEPAIERGGGERIADAHDARVPSASLINSI